MLLDPERVEARAKDYKRAEIDSGRFRFEKDLSLLGWLVGRTRIVDAGREGESEPTQTRTRFTDLAGYAPSPRSIARLPNSIWTKLRFRKQPLMAKPAPWLVYDAIAHLESLLTPETRVLEVGGGNSTVWFLHRGVRVTTIESNPTWAELVETRVQSDPDVISPSNLRLIVRRGAEAIDFIDGLPDGSFDIVLIDSIPERVVRGPALRAARPKLKPGGHMVLDNSDSPAHRDALAAMSDKTRTRYSGFTPMRLRVSQTSFWQV